MRIVVGIPTVGRAAILLETLAELGHQTRLPDAILVCGASAGDVAGATEAGAVVMLSEPGLPRQRNVILDATDADIVVFFDDDFLPQKDYLAAIERQFASSPDTVVATGVVLADGINGPGLSVEEGRAILERPRVVGPDLPVFTGYGCNMAIRMAPLRAERIRVDERLPLYGWQEDVDLSRCLAPFGAIVAVGAAQGVHLGVKLGRGKGTRLGYSQVANPLYLARKRSGYPLGRALGHIARNMAMNLARASRPEPYVDRRGRLQGNLRAIADLLTGRMKPERILDL